MLTLTKNAHPIENIGLVDRVIRLLLGAGLIGTSYVYLAHLQQQLGVWDIWASYAILFSIYPMMTAMLGWDPLYALFNVRTCGDTGRHQSGSMPYQIATMFGHTPKYTESDRERSLGSTHEEPEQHPQHKVWHDVDQGPAIYPDDKAWRRFLTREGRKGRAKEKTAAAA